MLRCGQARARRSSHCQTTPSLSASLFALTLIVFALGITPVHADDPSLKAIHKVFIEKMPNDLDQYISAEITKQMNGRLVVVLDKADADAIMRGVGTEQTGVGATITGRYMGLHDTATGSISIIDKDEKVVLWSGEAGDRKLFLGRLSRGGERKVADRLISDLKKALERAK